MKKYILSLIITLIATVQLSAIPACPDTISAKQADGTTLHIRLYGDEFFSYATTADNYLIKFTDNNYQYARWDGTKAIPTGVIALDPAQRSAQHNAILSQIGTFSMPEETFRIKRNANRLAITPKAVNELNEPKMVPRGIILLLAYTDDAFTSPTALQDFTNFANLDGYNVNRACGSAKNYFEDASFGQYSPSFDVFGPYTLPNNKAYYGAPSGDRNDIRAAQMVVDGLVLLMAAENDNIDLSQYDSDNDGEIDNVFVVYAGEAESNGGGENTIWPHQSQLYNNSNVTGNHSYQGKMFNLYACTSENTYGDMCGIGTFCHEFTHVLGFPDIYDVNYSGHKTSGGWDIMASGGHNNGGHTPAGYTAYERWWMGWTSPRLLNTPGHYTLPGTTRTDTAAYIISYSGEHNMVGADPIPTSFFTLENRVNESWDEYIPGNGLIITRIAYNSGKWASNNVNVDANNMGVDIIEADSNNIFEPGFYDAFPGHLNRTSYSPYPQYPITEITLNNDLISFNFMATRHTVHFNAWDYGTCNTTSLTEQKAFEGITLPNVTPQSDYTFEGWSTYRSAHIVNIGTANQTYKPTKDITLYAVYSQGGEIVIRDFGCFVETFNSLTADENNNINTTIDTYADNTGWKGNHLSQHSGAIRVGADAVKGEITTPALNIQGNAYIHIRAMGHSRTDMTLEIIGSGELEKVTHRLYTIFQDYKIFLKGANYDTQLKLSANINQFYIDSIEICKTTDVATPIIPEHNVMIINNQIISGLQHNDIVSCININGQTLWTKQAESETMQFNAPTGAYIIHIIRDEKVITIKSRN